MQRKSYFEPSFKKLNVAVDSAEVCLTNYRNYLFNTVCKKSIRVLEIFRVQKLILNATS